MGKCSSMSLSGMLVSIRLRLPSLTLLMLMCFSGNLRAVFFVV